jgi:hypothetical protein
MPATAASISAKSVGDSKPSASNLVRLDNRTRLARRINELRGNYLALGGERAVTPVVLTRIESAPHLIACAETARDRYLGGNGDLDSVCVWKTLPLALSAPWILGKKVAAPAQDLLEYLASKRTEGAAA